MATKPKDVRKIKQDALQIYKALTKYLITGDEKLLEFICRDKKKAYSLRSRVLTYFMNYPKFMWYVDKYINGLFDFNKWTDQQWFKMFHDLTQMFGITNTNQLHFVKFETNEYADFVKLIRDYNDQFDDCELSSGDIQALYLLYCADLIPEETLDQIYTIVNGKESARPKSLIKSKSTQSNISIQSGFTIPTEITGNVIDTKNRSFESLNPNIQVFIKDVHNFIKSRRACNVCSLRGKPTVILDTNLIEPGPVDLLFMALNPGRVEAEKGIPLIGDSGQIFRKPLDIILNKYPKLTYLLTNCILCSTSTEKDIEKPLDVAKNCSEIVNLLRQQFPAKITILVGDKAMKSVGVKGNVSKLSGEVVDGYFIMIHPSSLQYGDKNRNNFNETWASLDKLIQEKLSSINHKSANINVTEGIRLDPDSIITNVNSSLTLFDIRHSGEDIVYMFKDKDGRKKYMMETVQSQIFIKSGQYSDCPNITDAMEYSVILSNDQQEKLTRTLYNEMKNLTG